MDGEFVLEIGSAVLERPRGFINPGERRYRAAIAKCGCALWRVGRLTQPRLRP